MIGLLQIVMLAAIVPLSIVTLISFVLIIMKMFANDDATLGIICIVASLCGGIGGLIVFVMGWINVAKYNAHMVMYAWTGVIVIGVVVGGIVAALGGLSVPEPAPMP